MPKILTIDDARAVRMLVRKALKDMPFEIEEAEDGEKGLAKLGDFTPDLILLDVTMPVMDGPTMLKELRAQGDKTAVILLTAESGSTVIGPMLSAGGVCDYIIKPFKPDQLRAKVIEALQSEGIAPNLAQPSEQRTQQKAKRGFQPTGKVFEDVLLIDDMENVAKKFRTMLPEHTSFSSSTDRSSAMNLARERVYRTIVIDTEIPDVDTVEMLRDLRILQPTAAFVALVMRTSSNHEEWMNRGFDSFLVKPFDGGQVAEFLGAYFESLDLLDIDQNVLTPSAYTGPEDGLDGFYKRLATAIVESVDDAAAACFDQLILNLDATEPSQRLQKMMVRISEKCAEVGMPLAVVGSDEVEKLMKQLVETAEIAVFRSLDEAQSAKAS